MKIRNKIMSVALAVVLCVSALSGCGKSRFSVSDANEKARIVNDAVSSELNRAAFGGGGFGTVSGTASLSFGNVTNGNYSIKWSGVSSHPDLDLEYVLLSDFDGYAYVEFDPVTYTVEYALWSPEQIPEKYKHKLSLAEEEQSEKDGTVVGCYPQK
ncbi:MAG: hypothetical protein ACI4JK_04130 [Oscillospiraceae bacterium]